MADSFFSLIFRQKYINRWGLMRSGSPESLSQHSMECAVIAHALAVIGKSVFGREYDPERAAVLGLFHDAPEVFTGDLPTPVKYSSPEMRRAYAEIESEAVGRLLNSLPDELRTEYSSLLTPDGGSPEIPLVKAADKLCAYIKCLEEQSMGSHEFDSALRTIESAMDALNCDELNWFRKRCLSSFTQTLDEM